MGLKDEHLCECPVCDQRADEIERLRAILRTCERGAYLVDLGDDEFIALRLYKPADKDGR